jgi:hypothetical protein
MGSVIQLLTLAQDPYVLILILAILAALFALAIIFRSELGEKIRKVDRLGFSIGNWKVDADFGEGLAKVSPQRVSRILSQSESHPVHSNNKTVDFEKQSARDVVLEAWVALKQSIYNACAAKGISVTPATSIDEAMRRLRDGNGVKAELQDVIASLDRLGGQLANNKKFTPGEDAARKYREIAFDIVDWMTSNVFWPRSIEPVPSPPLRRGTVVGGEFVQPREGNPSATLIGIGGSVRGQRFSIDKPQYRIGRSSSNDLRISEDDSVSGEHAYLRYEKGGLFLFDQGSRNGTFLNEQRVTGTPFMVRHGDRIRLGESLFEVAGASPSSRLSEEKDQAAKVPSPRSVVR